MNNTLTVAELKRRGMAAIDDGLQRGPIRILERNKSAAVVISAEDFDRLSGNADATIPGMTAMQWLLAHPAKGRLSEVEVDRRQRAERDW
ncbi:MAG: hypothetical protein J0L88_03400 [Xanthomonadales bacterium]|nr:hypothetical protein [Xanthomonadales bacterium]